MIIRQKFRRVSVSAASTNIQSCQFGGAVIGSCGNAKNVRGCFVPEDVYDCGCVDTLTARLESLVEGFGIFFAFFQTPELMFSQIGI